MNTTTSAPTAGDVAVFESIRHIRIGHARRNHWITDVDAEISCAAWEAISNGCHDHYELNKVIRNHCRELRRRHQRERARTVYGTDETLEQLGDRHPSTTSGSPFESSTVSRLDLHRAAHKVGPAAGSARLWIENKAYGSGSAAIDATASHAGRRWANKVRAELAANEAGHAA